MKTAIQELFSQLEIEQPNLFNTTTLEGRKFINDYYKFFELEKQQLSSAYQIGIIDGLNHQPRDYYNETFKTK
jgi:hypothetical protein